MNYQDEPLYDYPVSYTFRQYEAYIHEGMYLQSMDPPEPLLARELEVWDTKQYGRLLQYEGRLKHSLKKLSDIEEKSLKQRADRAKRKSIYD